MTAPSAGIPNAGREVAATPASSSKGTQRTCCDSRSESRPAAPATLPAAWPAAERSAAIPLRVGETQVTSGIFATTVNGADRRASSLTPAASRNEPGARPPQFMAAQMTRNAARFQVRFDTRKMGGAKSRCRRATDLAAACATDGNPAGSAVS